jgi:hypothetical protein
VSPETTRTLRTIDRSILIVQIAIAIQVIGLIALIVIACTPRDRATAARTALDAVDQADRTCADLREVLHPDAGEGGAP